MSIKSNKFMIIEKNLANNFSGKILDLITLYIAYKNYGMILYCNTSMTTTFTKLEYQKFYL